MRPRHATADQVEFVVRRYGPQRAARELRRRGLIAPIAGAAPLAVDTSTPQISSNAPGTSATSRTFSPPAGSVIFACIMASGGGSSTQQTIASVTDSLGSHLTWTQLALSNTHSASVAGLAAVYYAPCPSAQTNMTFTANLGIATGDPGTPDAGILPIVYTNAATTQNGNTAIATSTSGTPSKALTGGTNAAGSDVITVVLDWTTNSTPTVISGQTVTINGFSTVQGSAGNGLGMWVQHLTANAGSAGTAVTGGDTAPTTIAYNMVVVEVLADTGTSASGLSPSTFMRANAPVSVAAVTTLSSPHVDVAVRV